MLNKEEILEKIERKKFIEECRRYGICPECGGDEWVTGTKIRRSFCYRQYGIDKTYYCIACLSKQEQEILKNPHITCDNCNGTDFCPHPDKGKSGDCLDGDDIDDHNSNWGGAGPDCPIMRREAAI